MKNKSTLWVIGLVVIVIVVLVITETRKTTQVSGFRVGLISILSGEYSVVGQSYANGVILANEHYNAAHPDAKIDLTVEDDGFTGGKGVSAYQKLVNVNKIDALINASSPTIDSIYTTVVASGMPVIQGGEQGIEPEDDNVFGVFPNSVDSEYEYGVYMREHGVKEMTLVYTDVSGLARFVEAFKRGFQGTVREFKVSADEKDFRTHALKVSTGLPKTLGIIAFPQQGAQFLKEYFKVDKSKPQYFFDASFQSGFADYQRILGDLAPLNGALVGTINLPTTQEFKDAYKKRFGTEAGFLADIGYDAFNVLASNYSTDSKTWLQNIKNIHMTGASGVTQFGPTGNRLPDTKFMTVIGGKLSEL